MKIGLTPKQKYFSRLVASGTSQTDAYRVAYSAKNMMPSTIHKEAYKLMNNPKVATMVEALNSEADCKIVSNRIADKQEILETLTRLMRGEENADANRVRATQLLAQAQGLLKESSVVPAKERSSEEIRLQLIKKLEDLNLKTL